MVMCCKNVYLAKIAVHCQSSLLYRKTYFIKSVGLPQGLDFTYQPNLTNRVIVIARHLDPNVFPLSYLM